MKSTGGGSVINMSSIAWIIPSTGLPAYVTAKTAIVGLIRAMAHELGASNIRVNSVLPGAVLTERQQRLWWTPEYETEIMGRQALKRCLALAMLHEQSCSLPQMIVQQSQIKISSLTMGGSEFNVVFRQDKKNAFEYEA